MSQRSLRLIDCKGNFVRALEEGEAETLLASGKVKVQSTGRRSRQILVLLSSMTVNSFRSSSHPNDRPGIDSTYREWFGGQRIRMQKRSVEERGPKDELIARTLQRWDNDLTFDELRAGQVVSQTARERKAIAEWRRKNLVACLAYSEQQRAA